jgi:hypothetical protein
MATQTVCAKCGIPLTRDFAGWMHSRKPEKVHRPKPAEAAA